MEFLTCPLIWAYVIAGNKRKHIKWTAPFYLHDAKHCVNWWLLLPNPQYFCLDGLLSFYRMSARSDARQPIGLAGDSFHPGGFPGGSDGKESACIAGDLIWSLGWEDSQGREWLPTPVFLSGEFHGQRRLMGYSPRGCKESDTTEWQTLSLSSFTPSCWKPAHFDPKPVSCYTGWNYIPIPFWKIMPFLISMSIDKKLNYLKVVSWGEMVWKKWITLFLD